MASDDERGRAASRGFGIVSSHWEAPGFTTKSLGGDAAEHSTETALAPLVFNQRDQRFASTEIRPQCWGEVEFRIGKLPQQKVADTGFAARSD